MARIGQLTSQIVTGQCPECNTETLLVSFEPHIYRCVNCGFDLEQKVNGVIKYVVADEQTKFKSSILPDEDQHGKEETYVWGKQLPQTNS